MQNMLSVGSNEWYNINFIIIGYINLWDFFLNINNVHECIFIFTGPQFDRFLLV